MAFDFLLTLFLSSIVLILIIMIMKSLMKFLKQKASISLKFNISQLDKNPIKKPKLTIKKITIPQLMIDNLKKYHHLIGFIYQPKVFKYVHIILSVLSFLILILEQGFFNNYYELNEISRIAISLIIVNTVIISLQYIIQKYLANYKLQLKNPNCNNKKKLRSSMIKVGESQTLMDEMSEIQNQMVGTIIYALVPSMIVLFVIFVLINNFRQVFMIDINYLMAIISLAIDLIIFKPVLCLSNSIFQYFYLRIIKQQMFIESQNDETFYTMITEESNQYEINYDEFEQLEILEYEQEQLRQQLQYEKKNKNSFIKIIEEENLQKSHNELQDVVSSKIVRLEAIKASNLNALPEENSFSNLSQIPNQKENLLQININNNHSINNSANNDKSYLKHTQTSKQKSSQKVKTQAKQEINYFLSENKKKSNQPFKQKLAPLNLSKKLGDIQIKQQQIIAQYKNQQGEELLIKDQQTKQTIKENQDQNTNQIHLNKSNENFKFDDEIDNFKIIEIKEKTSNKIDQIQKNENSAKKSQNNQTNEQTQTNQMLQKLVLNKKNIIFNKIIQQEQEFIELVDNIAKEELEQSKENIQQQQQQNNQKILQNQEKEQDLIEMVDQMLDEIVDERTPDEVQQLTNRGQQCLQQLNNKIRSAKLNDSFEDIELLNEVSENMEDEETPSLQKVTSRGQMFLKEINKNVGNSQPIKYVENKINDNEISMNRTKLNKQKLKDQKQMVNKKKENNTTKLNTISEKSSIKKPLESSHQQNNNSSIKRSVNSKMNKENINSNNKKSIDQKSIKNKLLDSKNNKTPLNRVDHDQIHVKSFLDPSQLENK